jgi:hypothetical protein
MDRRARGPLVTAIRAGRVRVSHDLITRGSRVDIIHHAPCRSLLTIRRLCRPGLASSTRRAEHRKVPDLRQVGGPAADSTDGMWLPTNLPAAWEWLASRPPTA